MRNNIYRSNVYLGADYSDGIQHFKYIRREKRNGKWVYYYDNEASKRQNHINKKTAEVANIAADSANGWEYTRESHRHKSVTDGEVTSGHYIKNEKIRKSLDKKASEANRRYYKGLISSVPRYIIGNGLAFVNNIFVISFGYEKGNTKKRNTKKTKNNKKSPIITTERKSRSTFIST